MENPQSAQINIVSKPIATAVDGNALRIQDNGQAELLFFQVVNKDETTNIIDAAGVAAVRMTLDQLEQLNSGISKAIETFKAKSSAQPAK